MVIAYYDIVLALSLAMAMIYVYMWHKHFDVHITLIFVLVPLTNLGFAMQARAETLDAALAGVRLSYLGGCFLLPSILFAMAGLCQMRLNRWLRLGMMLLSSVMYVSALSIGIGTNFYRSVSFERVNGLATLIKVYGPMHTAFRCMIYIYFLASLGIVAYTYFKKNQVSRKLLMMMVLPVVIAMVAFFGGRKLFPRIELVPVGYAFALMMYLIIAHSICMYDITDAAVDSLVESGDTGLVSFDFTFHYLGSNDTAKAIFPELNNLTVDHSINRSLFMREKARPWLEAFQEDEGADTARFDRGGRNYLIKLAYLYDGARKRGYQLFITDDTDNQRHIDLINRYNAELESEVADKTAHIVEMHDKLILGMATMVESRDNSTGGHIKRTSDGVRLLVDAMRADDAFPLSDDFCKAVVKAAPMHDLGKIAVDDAVLRKPGRFTPEEFEKMKAHAAEGARIVHEILKGTDDALFQQIAENVAHYHHERWDGSGYPEGLKGEEIPLEARIMAIADVYDALVSKRVYKESMSFEQAHAIIMDGMGKHFDKRLEPYYLAAKDDLEAYYSSLA